MFNTCLLVTVILDRVAQVCPAWILTPNCCQPLKACDHDIKLSYLKHKKMDCCGKCDFKKFRIN